MAVIRLLIISVSLHYFGGHSDHRRNEGKFAYENMMVSMAVNLEYK